MCYDHLGDNSTQNCHLGRYIISFMVGIQGGLGFVKHKLQPQNRQIPSPNDNFYYSYPHSNAVLGIFIFNVYYFASEAGALSNAKRQPIGFKTTS